MTTIKQEISTIEEAFAQLGVNQNTLTPDEKKALDEQGYVVFPRLIDAAGVANLQEEYERLLTKEGDSAGKEFRQEAGTRRLADLVNKSPLFDEFYTHPKVLAAVYHVLGRDFKLSSLNARDAEPGSGRQPLHVDWGARQADEPYQVVNSIWLIDDFTPCNGATRIVPGTHKLVERPLDCMESTQDDHPDQLLVTAPAGTVAVFNSHLWHGGTQNVTNTTRRACHTYFTARENPQQVNQQEYIRKTTYDRISLAARYILDVK